MHFSIWKTEYIYSLQLPNSEIGTFQPPKNGACNLHISQFGTERQVEKLVLHVAEDSLPKISVVITPDPGTYRITFTRRPSRSKRAKK